MRIFCRQKKAAAQPVRGRRPASANPRGSLSTFGGSLLALESRIMFDGAAVATVGTVTTEQIAQSQADAFFSVDDATTADSTPTAPTGEPQFTHGDQALFDALAAYDISTARQEILFLSTSVQDYQQLLDGISPNVEVIILDPARDGVEQMAEALAGRTGIDAVHLVGEGTEAQIHLGTSFLTQESISTRYAEQFQQIGQSLSQNADLLIYGCNFGRGEAGQVAMHTLAALTGADVAASTDRTGHSNEFGDWMLETSIGSVETSVVIDDVMQAAWEGVLATYTVDTTNDVINGGDGVTSLREAITAANGALGTDTIVFNIAGAGVHTINLASALPTITDTVILDATTQSGYVAGSPVIVLDGTGAGAEANGFVLQASNSTITGFRIQNFVSGTTSVTGTGIVIDGTTGGGDNNTISQNYLTNNSESVTGSVGAVSITGAADNNLIANNQLIDNNSDGIRFADALSTDNQFTTNTISGSGDDGVKLVGANITFTGNTVSNSQRLSGGAAGVELVTVTGTSVVSNNLISNDGTHGSEGGVWIANSSTGVTVGNNTITGWSGSGIAIGQTSTGIHLTQNAISNNGRLGIDLFPTAPQTDPANGVTPNDVGDGDAGANDLKNTPVLTAAVVRTASAVDISGSLSTLALVHNYRIEFFASTSSDPSGFGEGERYLGFTDVTTDGAGTVSFNVTLTASVTAGEVITATTNDLVLLETSEFSQYIVAANTAPVLDASKSPGLTAINEDAGAPSGIVGTLVSQLVDFDSPAGQVDNVTDTDSGALLGIAITGADTANGTWLYSTNNGASWNALGAVSDASTRLLAADANTRLYFQPNADYNGTIANAITFRAWDQTSGSNGTLTDTSANGGTTAFSTATDTASLVVNAGNDIPTITNLSSDSLAYNEGDGAVVIEQGGNALVADVDSADFNTGTLTVSFTAGSDSAEDVLSIRNQGTGAGQIGVSGANVTYQGVTIGTFTGGSSGTNLVLTFNASATPAAVTALVQNITYQDTDTNAPTTGARTVRYVLTDGDGGTSANYDTTVTVSGVNDAPIAADDRLALVFDGVDDFVQVSSNPVFEVTTHVTMEAWINPDASTNARQIIINREGEYEVALDPNGHIQWAFANADPGWAWHDTGVVVPLHTWSHIAISYDNGVITTYLNGVAAEVYNGSGAIGDNHAALDELRIGGRSNAPAGQYFDGRINEVQVWNVTRSGAEVLTDMAGGLTGGEAGLLGFWRFNENSGTTANNLVLANDDGTLGGGVSGESPAWTGYRINEDSSLNVGAPGILSNDFDADGNPLNAALVTGPSSAASFTLNPDGSFTYVPIANFSGTDSFTYRVNDGTVNSNIATVWIQVDPVDDPPAIADATVSLDENSANATAVTNVSDSFTGTDFDRDGEAITYSITSGNTGGAFAINAATGAITVATSSALDFETTPSFTLTITASDGTLTDTAAITVNLNNHNETPVLATNVGSTVIQGSTDLITSSELQVTDIDNTTAQLIYTVTTAPVNGQLELTTVPGVAITSFTQADVDAGRLVFIHSGAVSTSDSFTFTVSDGAGGTIGATTFNLTVTPFAPLPPPPPPPPPPPDPVPVPIPVPGPPGPPSGGITPPVLPPPVLISMVSPTDDPAPRVALPSRTFTGSVEQPDIVVQEPPVLELEALSNPVKTVLAVGHKLAEHLTRLADNLERAMQEREHQGLLLGRVASVSGMALSVGFVSWILRGGALVASFLVSMPAWRHFDPLPVLGSAGTDRRTRARQVREADEQEKRQFRGLDRVLDKSAQPAKGQETGRGRNPKAS